MNQERYTRLKSISDFGYDINWEELHSKKILIIGVTISKRFIKQKRRASTIYVSGRI